MSNPLKNINFNDLPYNLYELLNVKSDCDKRKIKKAYKKLIIQFHPDKCSELEEEIFHNISIAYQILKNDDSRKKYDNWLLLSNGEKSQIELKKNFKKEDAQIKNNFISREEAFLQFNDNILKLDKSHGVYNFKEINVNKNLSNKSFERNNEKKIKKEKFRDKSQFNDKFKNRKKKNFKSDIIKNKSEIISYSGSDIELKGTSIRDYHKLYVSDNVSSDSFSCLRKAYKMHPEINFKKESKGNKIKKYKKQTKKLSVLDFNLVE